MVEVTSRRMECTLLTPDHSQMPAVVLQRYMGVFCCHSNGLCTYLNAVFRYSIDCAITSDVDCACTSRHRDRYQEECASKLRFLLQTTYNSECFVAIATACART